MYAPLVCEGIVKKVFEFFSNYVPSEVKFFRSSGIDCAKPFFQNANGDTLFRADFDFHPNWTIMSRFELTLDFKIESKGVLTSEFTIFVDELEPGVWNNS